MTPRQRRPVLDTHLQPSDLLALYSAPSLDGFVAQTFRFLPRIVPCEYVSAFYHRTGEGFLRERDSRGRVWSRAFMRRYVELTAAIPLVLKHPGIKILPTRLGLPSSDTELHRMAFYREVMQPQGWRHGAALCFWAAPPGSFPIFVVTLYRAEGAPDFSDRELSALEVLHPFLAPVVSRFHEISVSDAISEGVATALGRVSPGVVVMDWQMRVVRMTPAGRRSLAEWNRTSRHRRREVPRDLTSLPACLLDACQELRQELATVSRRGNGSRAERRRYVSHPTSLDLLASVTVISLGTPLAELSFVIEFETPGHAQAQRSDGAAALAKLTKSEAQVALVIAEGCSNQEAAERLGKTLHAVKFLLHRTYQKLGVSNRARLSLLLRRNG